MESESRRRSVQAAAYVAAVVAGLAVVLTGALLLEALQPEPKNATVLVIVGLSTIIAAILGRATYHAAVGAFARSTSDGPPDRR